MFVVEVLPLDTGAGVDRLSYFSSIEYKKGTIVTVPVRARAVDAVVMSSTAVSSLKTALRAATFTLRRLPPHAARGTVSHTFLSLVERLSVLRALTESEVLSALTPKRRVYVTTHTPREKSDAPPPPPHVEVLVGTTTTRHEEYVRIVRKTFAQRGSVLCVVPTVREVTEIAERLKGGIATHTITLSSDTKASEHKKNERLLRGDHPLLIITTPTYAHIERSDIQTTIIEHARSRAFRGIARPYLDHRLAIMEHAHIRGALVVLGDLVLPAEDVERLRARAYEYVGLDEFPKRLTLPGHLVVIHPKKDHDGVEPFKLFSPLLADAITKSVKQKKHTFLLSARRGLAPLVACADCGHIFRDPESGAPLSLIRMHHDGVEKRFLVSSTSGYRELMRDVCPHCNSWRLRERGIGIQHIEAELKKEFPETPIFILDHTTATTHKKASDIARQFYDTDGALLLGTSLALPYLERALDTSAIVSMDSLLSLPSWRQQEEALATLLTLRERTLGDVYAQTRHRADDRILALASRADLAQFYDEEIASRKEFSYPPYSVFILLTFKGTKDALVATEALLQGHFARYGIVFYGIPPTGDAHVLRRGLMRFPRESWPDHTVVELLRSLPPTIKVEFDPDRIV